MQFLKSLLDPAIFPAITALFGSVIGASSTLLGGYLLEKYKHKKEAETYAAGFIAEVDALLTIIKRRNYVLFLSEIVNNPLADKNYDDIAINIPDDYAKFYNSNTSKIGLLSASKARKLVIFHQLLQSVIQDLKPDSPLKEYGYDEKSLTEMYHILQAAVDIGSELITQ